MSERYRIEARPTGKGLVVKNVTDDGHYLGAVAITETDPERGVIVRVSKPLTPALLAEISQALLGMVGSEPPPQAAHAAADPMPAPEAVDVDA